MPELEAPSTQAFVLSYGVLLWLSAEAWWRRHKHRPPNQEQDCMAGVGLYAVGPSAVAKIKEHTILRLAPGEQKVIVARPEDASGQICPGVSTPQSTNWVVGDQSIIAGVPIYDSAALAVVGKQQGVSAISVELQAIPPVKRDILVVVFGGQYGRISTEAMST